MADLATRALLAATRWIPLPHKMKWRIGMRDEIAFWDHHMATNYRSDNPGGLSEEARFRLDPAAPLQPEFVALVAHCTNDPIRILDVGCGPFSRMGKTMPGRRMELVAVDPLADLYAELHRKYHLTPAVAPLRGDGEELASMFPAEHFDLIHANNCLDHSYDPVKALGAMFTLLKPGCTIYLRHELNAAEGANYMGLHQWNFHPVDGRFWITDRSKNVNVCVDDMLAGKADLSLSIEPRPGSVDRMVNIIRKRA